MNKKYNLFKNTMYALSGIKFLLKEKAFIIELILFFVFLTALIFLDLETIKKVIIFMSLMIVLIVEAINTAIESCVDLATDKWHPLAKRAKDIASGAVFLSIIQIIIIIFIFLI
jgi:diacylglycerol kinase (ATP)